MSSKTATNENRAVAQRKKAELTWCFTNKKYFNDKKISFREFVFTTKVARFSHSISRSLV